MAELAVEHLEVRYGDLIGVADISLRVTRGQVVALARLQRRRQDDDAQCHCGTGARLTRADRLARRRNLGPGRLCDRQQRIGAVAGRLAAIR